MSIQNIRKEVMLTLEKSINTIFNNYLIPAEKIWQPTDFLPYSQISLIFILINL
jgi:acyl-[acyl-carrier-protein] desaturase